MSDEQDFAAELPDKLFFRIGEASQLVGVEPHVLRYWESEFKMRPQRSASGQRMYRRKDIARFLRIRRLLHDQGFTIAGARKVISGHAPTPEAATGDPGVLREVMEKLTEMRERLSESRKRLESIAPVAQER